MTNKRYIEVDIEETTQGNIEIVTEYYDEEKNDIESVRRYRDSQLHGIQSYIDNNTKACYQSYYNNGVYIKSLHKV